MKKVTVFLMFLFLSFMPISNINAQENVEVGVTSEELTQASSDENEGRKPNTTFLFNEVVLQILATIFLFVLIKKTAWGKISKLIEDRQNHINGAIIDANKQKEEANLIKNKSQDELEDLRVRKKEILDESKKEAKNQEAEIVSEARQKAEKIIEKANEEIKNKEEDVKSQLSKELAQMSVSVAEKFLTRQMDDEKEAELIQEAIKELESAK